MDRGFYPHETFTRHAWLDPLRRRHDFDAILEKAAHRHLEARANFVKTAGTAAPECRGVWVGGSPSSKLAWCWTESALQSRWRGHVAHGLYDTLLAEKFDPRRTGDTSQDADPRRG